MKKILLKLTIFTISLFMFCNSVLAYTSTLTPSKTTVNPGNTFTIKINLTGLTNGLGAAEYTLGFDNTLFEVSKVSTTAVSNTLSNQVKFTFVDMTGSSPMKNGTFATVTFKAKNITSDKTGSFTLSSKETADASGKAVTSTNKGTSVKVHIPDTDNTLKSLTINGVSVSNFSSNTLNYTYKTEASSIKIAAVANSTTATITGTGTKTVKYGTNTFNVVVKAENGVSKTYKITVTRQDNRESINTLESLAVNGYTITPTFNKNTKEYSLTVENDIETVQINATKTSTKSSFVSGYGSREVKLNYGENKVYVKVKAENETINTYTITIKRKDNRSTNNNLKTLTSSLGNIKFDKNTLVYSILTDQDEVTISAESEDTKAIISGIGTIELKNGLNEIKIVVKAENQTEKTYTIKITKVDDFSTLNLSNSILELKLLKKYKFDFSKDQTEYTVKIGDETSLEIDYVLEDENSTVEITGNENLTNGSVITIKVTSIDGKEKEYKINIEKESPVVIKNSGNNKLIGLFLIISLLLNVVLTVLVSKKDDKKEIKKTLPKEEKLEEQPKEKEETTKEEATSEEETVDEEPEKSSEEIQEIPDEIIIEDEPKEKDNE